MEQHSGSRGCGRSRRRHKKPGRIPGAAGRASATIQFVSSRILVVDDEPTVVEALREILNQAGHVTLGATTYEDGRRLLWSPPLPDVIIADVRLGRYNGLQLVV